VNKGVLKLNTASRRISRLSKKVNMMAEAPRP
jgi:ribosomal protein S20